MWVYSGTITNSKLINSCRSKVYTLAENHLAKIREGKPDGISYDGNSPNLKISVVFKDEASSERFQSEMWRLPSQYRMRKPDESCAVTDITVTDLISPELHVGALSRIWSTDYPKINGDASPSADCDSVSDVPSSVASAVELSEEVKLRLLDAPNLTFLGTHKPEKCHLKSQKAYPSDKSNPKNILLIASHLHCGFDGINQVDGVPDFALKLQSHSEHPISVPVGGGKLANVYEVTIRVEFASENSRTVYMPLFKDNTRVEGGDKIDLMVYVYNHVEFKEFLDHKYNNTLQRWAFLAGPEG